MTIQTNNNDPQQGVVKDLRKIRDQISHEIKEMTFAQERAYLDTLLHGTSSAIPQYGIAKSGTEGILSAGE